MSAAVDVHWDTPPAWWVDGARVWYFWEDYYVQGHQRYDDGSVTFHLTPVFPPLEEIPR